MRSAFVITVITFCLSACNSCGAGSAGTHNNADRLSEEEKHRLYSAALAASESPLDTETFKGVCQKIGIFDEHSKPNNNYMTFVAAHVAWGTKAETDQFRQQINSTEKARDYISRHLPR